MFFDMTRCEKNLVLAGKIKAVMQVLEEKKEIFK
jgi:hypothetical protein